MLCPSNRILTPLKSLLLLAMLSLSSAFGATISMLDDVGRFKFVDTTTGIATVKKFGPSGIIVGRDLVHRSKTTLRF
jgi:hypothetical protein